MKILLTATSNRVDKYLDILNKYKIIGKMTYYNHITELKFEIESLDLLFKDVFEKIEYPIIYQGTCINVELWDYWFEIYDDYRE